MPIQLATTDEEVTACFRVMVQLRPQLVHADELIERVTRQRGQGYRLAYLEEDGTVVAVAGFRIQEMLSRGRFLYVDDLVTDSAQRSRGHGKAMLDWLKEHAREQGCDQLDLDSGIQRERAHAFYAREGMAMPAYHFAVDL